MNLQEELAAIGPLIGHTHVCKMQFGYGNLYAKLEYANLMGSIKDRAAYFMMQKAVEEGLVSRKSVVVESTSGNFGIALAAICKRIAIKFIPVVDPNISREKEALLSLLSYKVVKVREKDKTGGYLLNRIERVRELIAEYSPAYNPNQYQNPYNYLSYYHTLGEEICSRFSTLDYIFIAVSSGGTITGLSLRLKEKFRDIKVVAVDVEGSLIFSDKLKDRCIPGIGAGLRTSTVDKALIDDVIILSQTDIIQGCLDLLHHQTIFGGGSSGAVYHAAKLYLKKLKRKDATALLIFPDKGNAYLDTIYNPAWVNRYITNKEMIDHEIS